MNKLWCVTLTFTAFASFSLCAEDATQIVAESQNRARTESERYEGTLLVSNGKQRVSIKRWVYARTGAYGSSKSTLRFIAPDEVKGVVLLVINHPARASDQWMWIPAEGRDRRIAIQDRSTRFFGTDFSFEDLEERDLDQYDYKLLGTESIKDSVCWKIQLVPKSTKPSQYSASELYIRGNDYVVARLDNYDKRELVRRITYTDVQRVQGVLTPLNIEVFDSRRNSRTTLKLDKVEFNVRLRAEDFTREALPR